MSKKERARLEAEQAEHQRMELERERQRKVEEEKMRKIREKEEAERKQVQEIVANKLRKVQLEDSYNYFALIKDEAKHLLANKKKDREVRFSIHLATRNTHLISLGKISLVC